MTASDQALNSPRDRLTLLLATGLGLGRIPFAPGTFGSLLGLPLAWGAQQLPWGWQAVLAIVFFILGIPLCSRAARLLRADDPPQIVYDEIAAFPAIFLAAPFDAKTAVAGFVLFRLFDVTKPWPVHRLERLPGGFGIMSDDLAAGAYAALVLYGVARWLSPG